MTEVFKELASRFCQWPVPDDVCADSCACIHGHKGRTGTNLLTVAQAEQMLRYVLAGEADYRAFSAGTDREADGTIEGLALVANMLEQYGIAELPANEVGQVDFMRALMESAVAEIRAFIAKDKQP